MATGKFRIKTSNDWNTIFYRFKHSNLFDIECSIGMQIPNKRWSESKQEVLATTDVNYKEINHKLKELNTYIDNYLNRIILSNTNPFVNIEKEFWYLITA